MLEYAHVMWDPHQMKHKTLLENVQLHVFATEITSKQWNQSSKRLNDMGSKHTYF